MDRKITAPFDKKISQELKAGDYVYITGTIYTARDAAHKRMDEALKKGEKLPFDVENNVIYYMGPSPARDQLDQQDQLQQAEWINMHQNF